LKDLLDRAIEVKADAVFYGHTHIANNIILSGIKIVNPGTLIKSAEFKTYAIVDVTQTGIEISLHEI